MAKVNLNEMKEKKFNSIELIFLRNDTDDSSEEPNETSSSSSEPDDHRSITTTTAVKKKHLKISVTFLESLSNYVPLEDKHPDAKQFVLHYFDRNFFITFFCSSDRFFLRTGFKNKKKRQELAEKLFSMYDEGVFSSKVNRSIDCCLLK